MGLAALPGGLVPLGVLPDYPQDLLRGEPTVASGTEPDCTQKAAISPFPHRVGVQTEKVSHLGRGEHPARKLTIAIAPLRRSALRIISRFYESRHCHRKPPFGG